MFETTFILPPGSGESPPTDRVIVLVRLATGLHIDAALLGTHWSIGRAPEGCELILPTSPDAGLNTNFAQPLSPPNVPGAAEMFERWMRSSANPMWGTTWLDDADAGVKTARITYALVVSGYSSPDAGDYRQTFAFDLGNLVESWLNEHAEWLEVLSHLDLQPHPAEGPQIGLCDLHNVVSSTTLSGDRIGHFGYARNPVHRGSESRSVSLDQWSNACSFTNHSAHLPRAHLHLRNARAALNRNDTRRTVIDACTAAEMSLAESVKRGHPLAGTMPGEVAESVAKTNGIAQLFDLHQAISPLAGMSRGSVIALLAGPRNQAAHDGAEPSADVARAALQFATRVVDASSPLPDGYIRQEQHNRGRIDMQLSLIEHPD